MMDGRGELRVVLGQGFALVAVSFVLAIQGVLFGIEDLKAVSALKGTRHWKTLHRYFGSAVR